MGNKFKEKESFQIPGPGDYDPVKLYKNTKVAIEKSKRKPLENTTKIPGPGAYEHAKQYIQ